MSRPDDVPGDGGQRGPGGDAPAPTDATSEAAAEEAIAESPAPGDIASESPAAEGGADRGDVEEAPAGAVTARPPAEPLAPPARRHPLPPDAEAVDGEPVTADPSDETDGAGGAPPGADVSSLRRGSLDELIAISERFSRFTIGTTTRAVSQLVGTAVLVLFYLLLSQGELRDLFIYLRGTAPVSGEVSLVMLGPEALYLWDPTDPEPAETPRALLAQVVRFLDAAGARVVVLDFLLDTDREGDALLAEAARAHGTVLGAERFRLADPATGRELQAGLSPALADQLAGGFANLQEEVPLNLLSEDSLVRAAPLVRAVTWARVGPQPWPSGIVGGAPGVARISSSLALQAAWLQRARAGGASEPLAALSARLEGLITERCEPAPLRCEEQGSVELLASLSASGLHESPGFVRLRHPLHRPLPINFRGPERAVEIPTVRGAEILRVMSGPALAGELGVELPIAVPAGLGEVLEGRVVVVGRDDPAATRHVTPFSFPTMSASDMAGSRLQAQVIDTLLSGRLIRPVGGGWLLVLLGGGLVGGQLFTLRRLYSAVHMGLWWGAVVVVLLGAAAVFSWTDGLELEVALPLLVSLLWLFVVHFYLQLDLREGEPEGTRRG